MGLHVDCDQIFEDNRKKEGLRKFGCLVNSGDKLTKARKLKLRQENQEKYGLTPEEVAKIKLPYVKHIVEIYEIDKIIHSKKKLSTVDKIYHLEKLKLALEDKLDRLTRGIVNYNKMVIKGGNFKRDTSDVDSVEDDIVLSDTKKDERDSSKEQDASDN